MKCIDSNIRPHSLNIENDAILLISNQQKWRPPDSNVSESQIRDKVEQAYLLPFSSPNNELMKVIHQNFFDR